MHLGKHLSLFAAATLLALCQTASATHVDERPAYFVEWIHGTGKPQIDTEYVFKVSPRVEVNLMLLDTYRGDRYVAGFIDSSSPRVFKVTYACADLKRCRHYFYSGTSYASSGSGYATNIWYDATWGAVVKYGDTVAKTYPYYDFADNTSSFALFGANGSDGMQGLRFGRVRMYDGVTLVRDLWPAVTTGGAPCMYDSVTDKCYLNYRTGSFTAGPQCAGYDYSASAAVTWSNLSGGRFDAGANWAGGSAPQSGGIARFSDSGTYAVTFPEAVSLDASVSVAKPSGMTTFDTTGASWTLPAADYATTPFSLGNHLAGDAPRSVFHVVQGDSANGVMKSENGVFRFTGGESPSVTFASGSINFHNIDDTAPATLNTVYPGYEVPALVEFAGGTSRLPKVRLEAAKGRASGTTLRFSGGTHDVFGTIVVKNRMALGKEIALEATGQGTKVNLLGGYDGYPSGNQDEGEHKAFHSDAIRVTDGATLSATGTYFRTFAADFQLLVDHATLSLNPKFLALGSIYNVSGFSGGTYKNYNTNTVVFSGASVNLGPSISAAWIGSYDPWGNSKSYTILRATNSTISAASPILLYLGDYLFKDCVGQFGANVSGRLRRSDIVFDGGAITNTAVWNLNSERSGNLTNTLTITGGDHRIAKMYLTSNDQGLNAPGILNVSGGTLTVPTEFYLSHCSGGHGILNMAGGELTTPSPGFTYSGSSSATINLLGGVWRVPSIGAGNTRKMYCDGGTIQARGASTAFFANNTGASSYLRLGPKGLRILTDYAVTVAAVFHDAPGEDGLLVKDGVGTLTLSGASDHARTIVTNGVLKYTTAIKSQRGVGVVNGARLDLSGANGIPVLASLTLGDTATFGEIAVDNGEFVTVTNFIPTKAQIRLTDAFTNGTYPVVAVPGEADAATAALWANNSSCPLAEGKAYTFTSAYDSESNTTTFSVTTADRAASSGAVIWQGSGTSWADGANWEGGAAPTATDTAVFSSETAPAAVSVPAGATAGALSFSAAKSYTLSGASPLALSSAVNGSIDVTAGSHTNAVPLSLGAVLPVNVAAGASLALTAPVTVGGIAKEGKGTLALSGANDLPYGIEVRDGTLAVADVQAIEGSANLLTGGTLRFTGEAAATPAAVTLDAGATTKSAVIRADVDTELTQGITVTSGAVIKRGAGTLTIKQPAGRALSAAAESGPGSAFAFEDGGTAPTTGFTSLNVAEGDLRVTTSGSVSLGGNVRVGLNSGDVGDAQPRLVVQSATISAGSRALQLGSSLTVGSTATNPAFVAVNSSVSLSSLTSGNTSSQVPVFPVIALTNATVSTTLSIGSTLNDFTTIRAVNSTIGGSVECGWKGGLDADLDGSFFRNDKRFFMTGNVYGTIRARNGSTIQIGGWMLYPPKRSMTLSFDASTFKFSSTLLFFHPEQHAVVAEAGGMNLDVPSGATATFRHPISGPGAVTKIGPGTAFFDLAQGANNWQGYANDQVRTQCVDTVTIAYAGPTTIAEGTVIVTNGAVRENAVFKLREAGRLNLRFCEQQFASVTGEGVVTNGGLVATTVAGTTNGVLKLNALSLDRVTFSYPVENGQTNLLPQVAFNGCSFATGVTVDFGHTRADPLIAEAEGVIATYSGTTAPDISTWSITGLGGHRSIAHLRAADGNIYLTLEKTPAGTILFMR